MPQLLLSAEVPLTPRSIDRKMVEGFCELADVPVDSLRSPAVWWNTSVCDTPGLLMMHVWNQGASPLFVNKTMSVMLGTTCEHDSNRPTTSEHVPPATACCP